MNTATPLALTPRSRSPTLSSGTPDLGFRQQSTQAPPDLLGAGSDVFLEDPDQPRKKSSPHVVTIPSPFAPLSPVGGAGGTNPDIPLDGISPRRTFFSLQPRPYPASCFVLATILALCFAPSNTSTSVFLQSLCNMLAPLFFIFLKQIWIPNPKDEVLVPGSIPAYLRKFGFISCLWYLVSLFSYIHINHAGPVSFVCTQVALPILILFLSKRLTNSGFDWDQKLAICLASVAAGLLLLGGALIYTEFHWSIFLSFVTVVLQALNLVWIEKYMIEVETDPWVFCSNIAPAASLIAFVFWLIFDRTLFDAYGLLLRNALLYGVQLIATTFLLHHLSAFSMAMLGALRDVLFLLLFWQLQNLHLRWFGYLAFLCFIVTARYLPRLSQEQGYAAVQNPI